MTSVLDRLIEVTAKRFNIEKEKLQADDDFFDKLGINSIDAVNLLTDIEMEFEVEIPDYELKGVTTFRQLAEKVQIRIC